MAISTQRRDRYRKIANRVRSIPGAHGLRETRVYIVSGVWSGTNTGYGLEDETVTEITEGGGQPPKVSSLNDERKALGQLPGGSIEIGPITPEFSAGGTDIADLLGSSLSAENTLRIRTVGPDGTADFVIVEVKSDRALRYMITAKPVSAA